jgi:hypothetical protein
VEGHSLGMKNDCEQPLYKGRGSKGGRLRGSMFKGGHGT